MAFDEGLAVRIREHLEDVRGITEKKMFGGLAFLLEGKMCCGIMKDALLARVDPEAYEETSREPHVRPMEFTGTPMKGFLLVDPEGLELDRELGAWIDRGIAYARVVLKKPPAAKRKPSPRPRPSAKKATKRGSKRRG
jgi:hypothetical protein